MKKSLITILIILILAGLGYFAYAKGLVKFDFLKKGEVVNEPVTVTENQQEKLEKIDPQILGKYIALYSDDQYIILNNDGTFISTRSNKASGKFSIEGLKIKFVYDDKSPDVILQIKDGYISGTDSQGIDYSFTKQDITLKSNPSYFYRRVSIPYIDSVEYNLFKIENGKNIYKGTLRSDGTMELEDGSGLSGQKFEIYKGAIGVNKWQDAEFVDSFGAESLDVEKYFNENYKKFDESQNLKIPKNENIPTSPKTNTTTTYMCGDKVKIMRYQDSPSLPPRISYVRVSDNAGIAYYGDMGAYIQPQYFSIDRSKIEEGYSFNETNFCKYLKN
jgi:hypothetical protein